MDSRIRRVLVPVALLVMAATAAAQEEAAPQGEAPEPARGAAVGPAAPKVDAFLASRLARALDERVAVILAVRPPPAPLQLRVPAPDERLSRPDRHLRAVQALRANAAAAQAGVLAELEAAQRSGDAREVEPFWIANYVRAEVTPDLLRRLAARPDVDRVYLDRRVFLEPPAAAQAAGAPRQAGGPSVAMQAVKADQAWAQGFTGRGILVANLDSGVEGDHPALAGKWRGLRAPVEQAWFDPFLNSTFPVDDDRAASGHGTATMGLLVGGDHTLGVAFDAEWIAANIFENNQSFVSTILRGLEWATDPDGDPGTVYDVPDVINASFGLSEIDSLGAFTDTGLCDDVFDAAIDAAQAAGAVLAFSAGNFNVPDPGDITSPASSLNALAVGATDLQGQIAPFSGRGPSLCQGPDRTKPNVVAPGVSVQTLNRNGGEQFQTGTSFSTPIAAGVAALVRQKNPRLTAEDVKGILLSTAVDLGSPGPDDTFGSGLADALAAVNATPPAGPVLRLTGVTREEAPAAARKPVPQGGVPGSFFLTAGENSFRVRVTNPAPVPSPPGGRAVLDSRSPLLQILDGETELPAIPPGGEAELPFRVRVGDAPAGTDLGLVLTLAPTDVAESIPFTLVVGEPVEGQLATHDANDIRMTVTNFGAIGFWLGVSQFGRTNPDLRGEGFHFPASDGENFLFHASLLVGRSARQVSDDLPYGNVTQSVNDFHVVPGAPFQVLAPGPLAAQEIVGTYDDSYNLEGAIGVSVRQHSYAFDQADRRDFVILTYDVTNRTATPLADLRFGLFADWDFLDAEGDPRETMDFVPDLRLGLVRGGAAKPVLGIVALNAVALSDLSYRVVQFRDLEVRPGEFEFPEETKFQYLSGGISNPRVDQPQDLAQLIGFGAAQLASGDSTQAAFAFVAGRSLDDLREAAIRARTTYELEILGRKPPPGGIPESLTLAPPFPNPLPPTGGVVTIGFGIPVGDLGPFESRDVELRVLDVRGRIVRTLVDGELQPGSYQREWDGLDADGRAVPSGVYAVLLEAGSRRALRKLVVVR